MAETYRGACFCGTVTVEVAGDPAHEGFCHCRDCRAMSGAPVSAYAMWPADKVRFADGADHVARYDKGVTGTVRLHCRQCGALLGADLPQIGMVDVFPLRLDGRAFRPAAHVNYASRVIDMKDGLPKFADFPAEAGGSGEMIEE